MSISHEDFFSCAGEPRTEEHKLPDGKTILVSEMGGDEWTEVQAETMRARLLNNGKDPFLDARVIVRSCMDADKKPQLVVQTRLFRDGQQVYAGTPSAMNAESQQDPKQLLGVGRVQFGQAPPGDYVLQVIVTDKLAKEKYRIAAQSMDFEIRP